MIIFKKYELTCFSSTYDYRVASLSKLLPSLKTITGIIMLNLKSKEHSNMPKLMTIAIRYEALYSACNMTSYNTKDQ